MRLKKHKKKHASRAGRFRQVYWIAMPSMLFEIAHTVCIIPAPSPRAQKSRDPQKHVALLMENIMLQICNSKTNKLIGPN